MGDPPDAMDRIEEKKNEICINRLRSHFTESY